eukprot:606008-Pyramimonas_sp.AAC.1
MDAQFPELLHRSWGGLPVPKPSVEATRVWTMEERDGLWQKVHSEPRSHPRAPPWIRSSWAFQLTARAATRLGD